MVLHVLLLKQQSVSEEKVHFSNVNLISPTIQIFVFSDICCCFDIGKGVTQDLSVKLVSERKDTECSLETH